MNTNSRQCIYGARVCIIQQDSDLGVVREAVEAGQQILVAIDSRLPRADYDALTARLVDLALTADATITAIQAGTSRPKGWRLWLSRLGASRAFFVTPQTLAEPSVAVSQVSDDETGLEYLIVGEQFRTE